VPLKIEILVGIDPLGYPANRHLQCFANECRISASRTVLLKICVTAHYSTVVLKLFTAAH
jgi:hypothetical protein